MPRKVSGEARQTNLNMRTTSSLRARLEASANQSGRALSHEVEHRLEQSYMFDRIAPELVEKSRQATIKFLSDTCGGPENLSAGIRVAQRLGFWSMPADREKAIEDLRAILPAILGMEPLPLTASRTTDISDSAMFSALAVGDVPGDEEGRSRPPAEMVEGMSWESPENLKLYQPIDPEADLFKSVIQEAGNIDRNNKRARREPKRSSVDNDK